MIWGNKLVKNSMAALAAGTILLTCVAATAGAATPYTASEGDTFWKLSKRFDIPVEKIVKFNPDVNPRNVYAGLKLTLPASGSPAGVKAQLEVAAQQAAAAKKAAAGKTAPTVQTVQADQAASTSKLQASLKLAAASVRPAAPAQYKESLQVKASAYTAAAEENGWGAVDYFGNPLKVGTVAVDPKVIPLGTKLFVEGYDYAGLPAGGFHAVASDTGGGVKGHRIDIFVPDSRKQALKFGIQYVTVYVL